MRARCDQRLKRWVKSDVWAGCPGRALFPIDLHSCRNAANIIYWISVKETYRTLAEEKLNALSSTVLDPSRRASHSMINPVYVVNDDAMLLEDINPGRLPAHLVSLYQRDLNLIKQDLVAVRQETSAVRATMQDFSVHARRALPKSFFIMHGVAWFIIVAAVIIFQPQIREWMHSLR